MEHLTQAAYAKHRGVSRQAINKLVKAEKIPVHGPRKCIDPAEADRALGETRERINVPADDELPLDGAPSSSSKLTEHKAFRESYLARLSQLDYEERIGLLLPIEGVTRAMERCAESVVRDIDQLASHADDLAGAFKAGGMKGLRAALKRLSHEMRDTVAANMRLLGEQEDEEEAVE